MKLNTLFIWALLCACFSFLSCKRTIEGESQNWESNSARVTKLKQRYPQFQTPIDQQFAAAKAKWDEAQSISGEEQKLAAMSAANSLISTSFLGTLDEMEYKKTQLRDMQQKLRNLSGPAEVSYRASSSITECDQAISSIDMTLSRGATTVNEAENVLQLLKNSVDNSLKHSNDVVSYANDLERKKQQDLKNAQNNTNTNSNPNANNTGVNTTPETPATIPAAITCKYCGTSNPSGTGTCGGCKAPL